MVLGGLDSRIVILRVVFDGCSSFDGGFRVVMVLIVNVNKGFQPNLLGWKQPLRCSL